MSERNVLSERKVGDAWVMTVEAPDLDASMADVLLVKLRDELAQGKAVKLVLDLSGVNFIDSVALGTLVVLLRQVKEARGRLALAGLKGHSLRVMEVTGLEKVFELYENVAAAVEALKLPG